MLMAFEMFQFQIKFVLAILVVANVADPVKAAPPVNKFKPYDKDTACKFSSLFAFEAFVAKSLFVPACYFQGRFSLYEKMYNINNKICVEFYGKLELDSNMEEVELQVRPLLFV